MSSSFDSGGPRDPDNLPFGWIVVDGQVVFAADYWKARAEAAEGKLDQLRSLIRDYVSFDDHNDRHLLLNVIDPEDD